MTKTIGFDFDYGAQIPFSEQDEWQRKSNGYTITLRYDRRTAHFDYWMGEALTDDPTLDGVMGCLILDAQLGQQSFRDFCDELGYDQDSRKAEASWKACQRNAGKLARLFGSDLQTVLERGWDI